MEGKINRLFWINYVFFCVGIVVFLELTGLLDLSTMDTTEDMIFITFLIICGIVMRYWFRANPEEVKRIFKL
jgi:hypothetical protein